MTDRENILSRVYGDVAEEMITNRPQLRGEKLQSVIRNLDEALGNDRSYDWRLYHILAADRERLQAEEADEQMEIMERNHRH